jgi:hypothetical protein
MIPAAARKCKRAGKFPARLHGFSKGLAEFAPAGANQVEISFSRRRVRRKKLFSVCKCGNCASHAAQFMRAQTATLLSKEAADLF